VTQPANTGSTYKYTTIREDLEDMVYKISPTECPIMQAIGRKGNFESTYHEWSTVELAAASAQNKKIEGDDATNVAPTTGNRFGNYSQLSDKVKQVSSTNERVRAAGSVQKMAKQILYGTQELKRDIEMRLASALPAVAGSDTVARETAGLGAFIRTNAQRGATGANGTLSGGTVGYPNGAETTGTARAFTEAMLAAGIQAAWTQGGNPTFAFMKASDKALASAFTGNATRYRDGDEKKLVASIAVYESDFGEVQMVPSRFMDNLRVLGIDPEYAEVGWLQPMANKPLAKTGHSDRRMVYAEWGVIVGNEKAHFQIADLS
jgi:hypothetical protein